MNNFWKWDNYILSKIIGGCLLTSFLASIENKITAVLAIIIGFSIIFYGVFVLIFFLYGCFVILPKTKTGEIIKQNDIKRKKEEDKKLEEYGTIDYFDE